MLNYKASPTGERFLADRDSFVKVIMGPVGGGKSTVALMELLQRAVRQEPFMNVRRTKFIILRNTIQQLMTTVKPLIDQWLVAMTAGVLGQWRLTDKTFELMFRLPDQTVVHSELVLMAADTPDDVRRLLSVEASAAWVEEAREVDQAVFEGLMGRVNRFPARIAGGVTQPGVICSTNAPNVETYWQKQISNPPRNWGVYIQPPALLEPDAEHPGEHRLNPQAENLEFLAENYYANLIEGKSEEWLDVYVRNKFGPGNAGQPLYRGLFRASFHVSPTPLTAVPQSLHNLVVGMDNGLQAAAVIGQRDVRGRLNIVGEAFVPEDAKMGVETFLDTLLVPYMQAQFPLFSRERVLFVLDPACFQRSQVDERTIADAVRKRGFRAVAAPSNKPERRIQAVQNLLQLQVDGKAGLLVSPTCNHTEAALSWGHRYRSTKGGGHTMEVEKNHHSHIGDAIQYLCLHVDTHGEDVARQPLARPVRKAKYRF